MNDESTGQVPWLPIHSAPKNGRILLLLGGADCAIGSWNPTAFDGPQWEDDGLEPAPFIVEPTHWMPLPEPLSTANWSCKTCGWIGLELSIGEAPEYHRRWNSKQGKLCTGNLIKE